MKKTSIKLVNVGVALVLASALTVSSRSQILAHQMGKSLPTVRLNWLVSEPKWVHSMDPAFVTDATSTPIVGMIQAGLVKQLPNGKVAPDLATWTVSKNHKVYTFTLRPNLRFSNGDMVTAQDAAYSITRSLAKDVSSPTGLTYLGHIVGAAELNDGKATTLRGLRVLSSRQLRITLDKPVGFFLPALTYAAADVLDRKVVNGKKPGVAMTTTCKANVGAGPFKLVCLNGSSDLSSFYPSGSTPTITMVPNPYYYGHKPRIKALIPVVPSDVVNYREYKQGGIDVTVVPSADIAREQHTRGLMRFPTSNVSYLVPDVTTAPFNNVHCRLAVAYAIDRETLNKKVLHGTQTSLYDVVPRGMLGYYSGKDNPHYNPAKARAELAQCPGGIKNVQFPYPTGSTDSDNMAAALSAMWSAVGIDLKPKPLPMNSWYDILSQPLATTHTAITQFGWSMDYNDPQDYVTLLNKSDTPYNIGGFKSARFDRIVDQADVTASRKKRAALYIQAQHILVGGGYQITIGQGLQYFLVNPKVYGFVTSLTGLQPRNGDWANISVSSR